jgi:hypothetical protein
MRTLALLIPALLLAACNQSDEARSPAPGATPANVTASPAVAAASPAGAVSARKVSEDNDLYTFDYAYPAAAAAIPSLKSYLDADLDKQKEELVTNATADKKEAEKNGYPYRTYSRGSDWKVVTDTPGWLSMSSMVSTYTGGAHPNYWFDTILWDKQANQRREPKDLFTSKEALAKAIQPEFCRQIDKQRAEKRGEPVKRGSDDPFAECLNPTDYVVILGSSNGKAFDRIGVLVPPYEAGPYAEGKYEATIPVNAAIMATVKPEFRSSFVAAR